MPDFNKTHPELRKGEVFLTNASERDALDSEDRVSSWDSIGWKTKRKGEFSYDIHGKPLGYHWPNSFPVFVRRKELEEAGINTSKM